jgi:hypothetical protein
LPPPTEEPGLSTLLVGVGRSIFTSYTGVENHNPPASIDALRKNAEKKQKHCRRRDRLAARAAVGVVGAFFFFPGVWRGAKKDPREGEAGRVSDKAAFEAPSRA